MDPAGLLWLFHLMAFVKLGGQHGTPARAEVYCLSPISSPISISPGKTSRKKKLVQIFIIVLKEPYFTRLMRHWIRLKWVKNPVGYSRNSTIVDNLRLNRIIVDNLIASLPQLLSF